MSVICPLSAGQPPILSASAHERGTRAVPPCQLAIQKTRRPAVRAATARRAGVAGRVAALTAGQARAGQTRATPPDATGAPAARISRRSIRAAARQERGIRVTGASVTGISVTGTGVTGTGVTGIRQPRIGLGWTRVGGIGAVRGGTRIRAATRPGSRGTPRKTRGRHGTEGPTAGSRVTASGATAAQGPVVRSRPAVGSGGMGLTSAGPAVGCPVGIRRHRAPATATAEQGG